MFFHRAPRSSRGRHNGLPATQDSRPLALLLYTRFVNRASHTRRARSSECPRQAMSPVCTSLLAFPSVPLRTREWPVVVLLPPIELTTRPTPRSPTPRPADYEEGKQEEKQRTRETKTKRREERGTRAEVVIPHPTNPRNAWAQGLQSLRLTPRAP